MTVVDEGLLLIRHIRKLASSSFARNVVMIASGAGLAQGLTLLAAPVLSRLFTPESFGLLGLFMALASLVGPSACLRYELPIVIARSERTAAALLHLCLVTAGLLSLVVLGGVFFLGKTLAGRFNVTELAPYLYWLPIHVMAMGVFLAMSQWACRDKQFSLLAQNPLTRSAATLGVQLGSGVLSAGAGWLVFGFLTGHVAATVGITLRIMRRRGEVLYPGKASWTRLLAAARRFRRFPQFSAPQETLNAASQQMPNFILAATFGPVMVGLYWMTTRVLQLPANLIGQAVRQVFYQRVCEILNQQRSAFPLTAKATAGLIALGAPAFLPILLFGPILFAFILGEPWRDSGEMARWVSLWVWAGFANVPAFCALQAMGAQRTLLVWEILLFLCRNSALVGTAFMGNALAAIAAYAMTGVVFNLILIATAFFYAKRYNQPSHMKNQGPFS